MTRTAVPSVDGERLADSHCLVDSHCHLDYLHRRGLDIAEIVHQARQAGVQSLLSIATEIQHHELLGTFCDTHDGVYRSVGVHPCHVQNEPHVSCRDLVKLSQDSKVIALGETGLDYFHDLTHKELQHTLFKQHIAAAQQTDLPLIIHTRAADDDTIALMQQAYAQKPFRGVFHCYIGSKAILQAAIDMDFYISLTGILTYKKSTELRAVIPHIRMDRLMLETDAPYLAPVPHRSQACAPAMLVHTAQCLADILAISLPQVARATTDNFFRLFDRAQS